MSFNRRRLLWMAGLALVLVGLALALAWSPGEALPGPPSVDVPRRMDPSSTPTGRSVAAGVQARQQDGASHHVFGRVVDEDGEPVDGGSVSARCLHDGEVTVIFDANAALDERGEFRVPGCTGLVCIEFHHPARVPAEPWVLEVGRPAVLRSRLAGRLFGQVQDVHGEPIVAATIAFVPPEEHDETALLPLRVGSTSTDEAGEFSVARVELPPCDPCTEATHGCDAAPLPVHERLVVVARAPGFAPGRQAIDVEQAGDPDHPVLMVLAPASPVLAGTLTDPAGAPYPRVNLLARSRVHRDEQHRAAVEGDSFRFDSLGAGPYELRAIQDGVELARVDLAQAGQRLHLQGSAPALGRDVLLSVEGPKGPMAGVVVNGGPFIGAVTDRSGNVRAVQAMPGTYTLRLRGPDGQALDLPLQVEERSAADSPIGDPLELLVELPR